MHSKVVICLTALLATAGMPAVAQTLAQAQTPPPAPMSEAAVEQRPVVVPGSCQSPSYPMMLREARIEGRVVLQFAVDTLGRVESGSISAVSSTHSHFENAARRAVQSCRYRPALSGDRAVRVLVQTPYEFKLAR